MMHKNPAWQALQEACTHIKKSTLQELFKKNPHRFAQFSVSGPGVFLDYSKNQIDENILKALINLARIQMPPLRDAMLRGEIINHSEQRAALHMALRYPMQSEEALNKKNKENYPQSVLQEIKKMRGQMEKTASAIRNGEALNAGQAPITDIVNIGIGGSHLGSQMAYRALRPFTHTKIRCHFVANLDVHDLTSLLPTLNPQQTVFIVVSKSFTTAETLSNAVLARSWLRKTLTKDWANHFIAVSNNQAAAIDWGIHPHQFFKIENWLGGRYSIWSAVGLSLMIALGLDAFADFLAGAYAMDQHFLSTPLEKNLPVLLALMHIWNRNFLHYTALCVSPYHHDLQYWVPYLQQLEMESNGKQVDSAGSPITHATCPVIWGDIGSNAQHSFFQLLQQGSDIIPVDFLAVINATHPYSTQQHALLANCIAQSETLLWGQSQTEVAQKLKAQGIDETQAQKQAAYQILPGNRPSNTLLLDRLDPYHLGTLIALYEHKVFVQGAIWGINSFDQWGVECGKEKAKTLIGELETHVKVNPQNSLSDYIHAQLQTENIAYKHDANS